MVPSFIIFLFSGKKIMFTLSIMIFWNKLFNYEISFIKIIKKNQKTINYIFSQPITGLPVNLYTGLLGLHFLPSFYPHIFLRQMVLWPSQLQLSPSEWSLELICSFSQFPKDVRFSFMFCSCRFRYIPFCLPWGCKREIFVQGFSFLGLLWKKVLLDLMGGFSLFGLPR